MLILLDNGHGGVIDGKYTTAPSKMYKHETGEIVYEGHVNRKIVQFLNRSLRQQGYESKILVPELQDIPLKERVRRANEIYKKRKDVLLISIHLNAGKGTGSEFFTSKGETKSDKYCEVLIDEWIKTIPELRLRKDTRDGDRDKEALFTIITKTHCPAVLVECAFMDTYKPDFEIIRNEWTIFCHALFKGLTKIIKREKR